MELLVTTSLPTIHRYAPTSAYVGRLFTPRMRGNIFGTVRSGRGFAADNDAFSGFDSDRWARMLSFLDETWEFERMRFAAVPDIVGDAAATRRRWEEFAWWVPEAMPRGYVLQNGQDEVPVPWDEAAAVFVGGDNDFKLGPLARDLVAEAKERGKWVHMGRVNSRSRMEYAYSIGVDSIDGSSFGRVPSKIAEAAGWLEEIHGSGSVLDAA